MSRGGNFLYFSHFIYCPDLLVSNEMFGLYVQVVVHDGDVQADVVHAVWRDVKDDGLIVAGIQGVLLYARLLLFQTSPATYERHFDVGI